MVLLPEGRCLVRLDNAHVVNAEPAGDLQLGPPLAKGERVEVRFAAAPDSQGWRFTRRPDLSRAVRRAARGGRTL